MPEHEVFRFGNGGTQVSQERWRLPTVVGGTLIVFWTSVVQVPSLGLLLGRDFLDAVGAVLNFARRALRCDHLDSSIIQLRQLTAGHFMLPLIPDVWKRPEALKWRRIGQDGIVEIQVSGAEWVRRRLIAKGIEPRSNLHEHLVTEQSFMAADIKFSGLDVSTGDLIHNNSGILNDKSDNFVGQPSVQATMPSAKRNCAPSSTSSSSRIPPQHGAVRSRISIEGSGSVDAVRFAPRRKSRLAHSWSALVVAAAALPSISSLSLSNSRDNRSLEAPGGFNGAQWSLGTPTSSVRSHQGSLHNWEPSGVLSSSQSTWNGSEFPGRSGVGRDDVGKRCKGTSDHIEARSYQRSQVRSLGSSEGRQTGRTSKGAHGLPTLKKDLLRLAALLNLELDGKETVDQLRAKCKPAVDLIKHGGGFSKKGASSAKSSEDSFVAPATPKPLRDLQTPQPSPLLSTSSRTEGSVTLEQVQVLMAEQGQQFQNMMSQVMTHMMNVAGQPPMSQFSMPMTSPPADIPSDVEMLPVDFCRAKGGGIHDDAGSERVPEEHSPSIGGADIRGGSPSDWKVAQRLKPGQQQLISQAWEKHVADRKAISTTAEQVRTAFEVEWKQDMNRYMNEVFAVNVALPGESPFVSEIYTDAQRILQVAQKRGHRVGPAMSLSTGWDFQLAEHRERALKWIRKHKPYVVVLAFPCSFWSPLQALNGPKDYDAAFERAFTLLQFALDVAEEQVKAGRRYILENPAGSRAWKLDAVRAWLQRMKSMVVKFDQCRYNLRGSTGELHMKPTFFATSAQAVVSEFLDKRCRRDHVHEQVIGGSRVTGPAGRYSSELAGAIVRALENQLEWELRRGGSMSAHDVLALEDGDDVVHEDDVQADHGELVQYGIDDSGSDVDVNVEDESKVEVSSKTMQAIKRLHEATGHRSTKRLARALVITGAPIAAILAAKRLKCSVCDERRRAKPRRPMSVPMPKDVNDQVHIDLLVAEDIAETRYFIVHMTDFASRYQMAGVLQSKASSEVIDFMKQHWLPLLGPPRVLVCDHGREFTSHEFEAFLASQGIYAFFTGIGAPWQNGIAERSGGSLRAILSAIVVSHSVTGMREMKNALGESVQA